MALVKRCDATRMEITDFDAGEGPMLCTTPDGYRIRVEVLPSEDGTRPHLREQAVKKMIELNPLFPDRPDDPAVTRLTIKEGRR